jgi:hypothetical protein
VHAAQLGLLLGRQLRSRALEPPICTGDGDSFAGAHAQQVDFEFGEGGQGVEEHLSHRVGRVVDLAAKG